MEPIRIPADTTALIGAPANPLPAEFTERVRALVERTPGVGEAHLPQCYVPGAVDPSAQVLVVLLEPGAAEGDVLRALGEGLRGILPAGQELQVWPLRPGHELLPAVRGARCQIAGPPPPTRRPWWKFWA